MIVYDETYPYNKIFITLLKCEDRDPLSLLFLAPNILRYFLRSYSSVVALCKGGIFNILMM